MLDTVDISRFCHLLGLSQETLPEVVCSHIKKYDFRYVPLSEVETANRLMDIANELYEPRKAECNKGDRWDACWNWCYTKLQKNDDALIPPYYKHGNTQAIYDNKYVDVVNALFEYRMAQALILWAVGMYMTECERIWEFGAGNGHNLNLLRKYDPDVSYKGFDLSKNAVAIMEKIGLGAEKFDLTMPTNGMSSDGSTAVFTMGALEQVGTEWELFLQYLMRNRPKIVVNIEPYYEGYDRDNAIERLCAHYHSMRGYLKGWWPRLQEMEKQGKIEIKYSRKVRVGGKYHYGWSIIIWRVV